MYVPFQDATFVPLTLDAGTWTSGSIALPRVDAIAARDAGGRLLLAVINVDPTRPVDIDVAIDGLRARSASGETLTASRVDSINTFEAPGTVKPAALRTVVRNGRLATTLPAKSVSVITLSP
jgi:alpha-N-arabinofuranosidase